MSAFSRHKATQTDVRVTVVPNTAGGFITTAHRTLLGMGVAALCTLGAMFVKPDIADHVKALSPFTAKTAVAETEQYYEYVDAEAVSDPAPVQVVVSHEPPEQISKAADNASNPRTQQWVTSWLSKRYRVAADATDMLVSAAYMTAKEIKLDPLLILSVMAIESGFNPFAESPVGAQGLMQVMSKVHHDKFAELGGIKAALNPVANIRVGSLILKDYVKRGGSVEAGLKLYVGAGLADTDAGYGAKVLAEYRRLKDVAMGKNVPIFTTAASSAPPKAKTPDISRDPKLDTESATIEKNDKAASADVAML